MNTNNDADSRPRLSIITVCRNIVDIIGRTAESIVAQSVQDFEWIVVDGASTDGTVDALLRVADDRINVLISEPDRGIYDAMNKGIAVARGDYLLFIDGGDELHNAHVVGDCLPYLYQADLLHGCQHTLNVDGSFRSVYTTFKGVKINRTSFVFNRMPAHQATFVKRELFMELGPYDLQYKIIADRVFLSKAAGHRKSFYHIPVVVNNFYIGGISNNSASSQSASDELRRWRMREYPILYLLHKSSDLIWKSIWVALDVTKTIRLIDYLLLKLKVNSKSVNGAAKWAADKRTKG
jgi:glycosyltransferase involved in cell wall biosynthesis